MWKDVIKAKKTTSPFTERVETKRKKRTSDRAKREEKKKRNILNKYPKDISKGEEMHPSVRGFQEKGKHKFRSAMIELKQRLKKLEEIFETKEVQDNQYMKQEYLDRINSTRRRIESLSIETGASFGSATHKDPLTGKEYKYSIAQTLSPSTKKPKVERMKRPVDAISYDPDEKDMNKAVMRRFGITEEQWEEMPFKTKKTLISAYYKTKD